MPDDSDLYKMMIMIIFETLWIIKCIGDGTVSGVSAISNDGFPHSVTGTICFSCDSGITQQYVHRNIRNCCGRRQYWPTRADPILCSFTRLKLRVRSDIVVA